MSEILFENLKTKFNSLGVVDDYQKIVSKGLFPFEEYFIKKYFNKLSNIRILNPGCGTGREGLALAKMGYSVDCIDISENMIKKAEENFTVNGLGGSFYISDCLDLSWLSSRYDLIFSTNNFLEHIPKRENRLKVLQQLKNVMKPNGFFFTGVHDRTVSEKWRSFWEQQEKDVQNGIEIDGYKLEIGDKFIDKITQNDNIACKMFMHIYSLEEILENLKEVGIIVEEYKYIPQIYEAIRMQQESQYAKDVVFLMAKIKI